MGVISPSLETFSSTVWEKWETLAPLLLGMVFGYFMNTLSQRCPTLVKLADSMNSITQMFPQQQSSVTSLNKRQKQ